LAGEKMACLRGLLYINLQKKKGRKTTNAAVINDDNDDD